VRVQVVIVTWQCRGSSGAAAGAVSSYCTLTHPPPDCLRHPPAAPVRIANRMPAMIQSSPSVVWMCRWSSTCWERRTANRQRPQLSSCLQPAWPSWLRLCTLQRSHLPSPRIGWLRCRGLGCSCHANSGVCKPTPRVGRAQLARLRKHASLPSRRCIRNRLPAGSRHQQGL